MKMLKETRAYKELRYSTGMEIKDLLGIAASGAIEDCDNCAIRELCESQDKYSCKELWAKYLKGAINGIAVRNYGLNI